MNNDDQKIVEIETARVSRLLAELPRVNAPGDFDFRVKARIARGRPVDGNASLLAGWVRFVVPLVLLLCVGAFFGFRSLYVSPEPNVLSDIASQQASIEPEYSTSTGVEPPANKVLTAQVDEKSPDTNIRSNAALPQKLIARTGSSNRNSGGGSYVESSGVLKIFHPKGLNANRLTPKLKDLGRSAGIAAKDILSQIGVDAGYSGTSWRVGSVKEKSIAERSGLKAGDVVEAINGQGLTEKTSFPSPFSGKSLSVRREGKSVQIELKP